MYNLEYNNHKYRVLLNIFSRRSTMFHCEYKTQSVRSQLIKLDLDGETVRSVIFIGGCSGSLKAIGKLVWGMKVKQLAKLLRGSTCGVNYTACADRLAIAVDQACEAQKITVERLGKHCLLSERTAYAKIAENLSFFEQLFASVHSAADGRSLDLRL